jgi:hypothetical protein
MALSHECMALSYAECMALSHVECMAIAGLLKPMQHIGRQLAAFTVGLIDGRGSLQVNHSRSPRRGEKGYLHYRLVLKLKNTVANGAMLLRIAAIYGGSVHKGLVQVQWVVKDHAMLQAQILPLLATYPPITARVASQVAFMHKAMAGMTLDAYLATRSFKHADQPAPGQTASAFQLPAHFAAWLVGLIEANGTFAKRAGQLGFSLSIGLAYDQHLLAAILQFLKQQHLPVQQKTVQNGKPFY